jgi:hypothetical protein
VAVRGCDIIDEHGSLLVLFDSSERPLDDLPEGAATRVRMGWERASLRLTPLPCGATRGTLIAHVDPRMPGDIEPPKWAVSWALKVLCPFIFNAACRLVGGIGAPGCRYAQRMAANPKLYDLVRGREAEFRDRLPPAAAAREAEDAVPAAAAPRYLPTFLATAAGWG